MARAITQERLLLTAERLFAQEGIDAVSMRRIAQVAEQRNISALQYHFGGRDQLIDALLTLRLSVINERREALLAALEARGEATELHGLLAALVRPLADELTEPESHFIGFLQQLYSVRRGDNIYGHLPSELTSGLSRVSAGIAACLTHLPLTVRQQRLRLMAAQLVHSMADWYYQRERGTEVTPLALMSADLIDFLAGGLMAPVSAAVSSLLEPPRQ